MRNSSERAPSLSEVMRRHIEAHMAQVRTCIPAVVTAYDAGTQKVSVKPLVRQAFLDEEDERQTESVPVIAGVPLMFPGAGPFRVTFPISDGNLQIDGNTIPATTGTLFFTERSIDVWLSGSGSEVDPEIDRMHDISDGIFVAGLNPFGAALSDVPTDRMTVGYDGGVQAHFHSSVMKLGDDNAVDFATLGTKLDDALYKLFDDGGTFPNNLNGLAQDLANMAADPIFAAICTQAAAAAGQGAVHLLAATTLYFSTRVANNNFQSTTVKIGE